jgi:pyruvate dehydrogenase E2 component (dihydrolipoamide acetyltransferase)
MATKVFMEALSPTMEEGRVIAWMKDEGDQVSEGDVLAEVETDKATMELVARGSGVLRKRLIGEGDTQAVGSLIAVIAGEDEDIADLVGGATEASQGPTSGAEPADAEAVDEAEGKKDEEVATAAKALAGSEHTEAHSAERGTRDAAPGERPTPVPGEKAQAAEGGGTRSIEQGGGDADGRSGGRVRASPLARRLAAEGGVALNDLRGSGPGGRIVKRDIEAALEAGPAAAPAAPAQEKEQERPAAPAPAPAPAAAAAAEYREVPLSQMRKTIAKRLTQSIGPVPHFFLTIEVDASGMMSLRKRINERFADQGIKVSPNDLIIKAVAMALTRHPWVNAAWTGEAIRLYHDVHIGIAVAVEEGLITPVVRNAHRKGVTEIAQEVKELAGRAREKKLKPEEYTGSTFSISNLGMFGIEEFTAVINPPEAAILAVGGITDRVVVEDGEMVVRPRLRVTLSCDHRVVDGATGAEFLQTLKRYLEDPMMMIA